MVTMVLLNVAWICTMPEWTTRFSFFLKLFFLVLFPAALAPFTGDAFATFAIGFLYVLEADFFLLATVPRRGPLRVRALVWVRWPRTGRLRRCRYPRYEPTSIRRLMCIEISLRRSPSTLPSC